MQLVKKINLVRKHTDAIFPYELIGENGRQLTNCGRITEESSSLLCKDAQ